jgi:hypothetical protein
LRPFISTWRLQAPFRLEFLKASRHKSALS